MGNAVEYWYCLMSTKERAEFYDRLAQIREEAGDHDGAERARASAAMHRP